MDLELKDKVAVITGGSVGIGLAVAVGLAAEGVHVVIIARQSDRVHTEAKGIADKYGVSAQSVFPRTSPKPMRSSILPPRLNASLAVPTF